MISRRTKPREMNGGDVIVYMARFEGADFLLDMETSVPSKKRFRGEDLFVAGNGRVDADYVSFLVDLHDFWDAEFAGVEEEGEEEDDADPDYLAFLGTLKEHGSAYMCDVSAEAGVLFPIIYEEKKIEQMSIDTHVLEKRNINQGSDLKSVRKHSVAENDSSYELKGSVDRVVDGKSCVKWSDLENNHLDGMKERRRTISGRDGADDRKFHFKKSDLWNDPPDRMKKRSTPISSRDDYVRGGVDDRKSSMKKYDLGNVHADGMKKKRKTPMPSNDDDVRENKSVDLDLDAVQSLGPKCLDFGKKMFEMDKNLRFFLDNIHFDGDYAFFEYGDQNRIYYESRNQQTTTFLTNIMRPSTPIPRPPASPSRAQITKPKQQTPRDAKNVLTASNKKHKNKDPYKEEISSYWRELHDYLRKPYDQKEYKELYESMSTRTPVLIHKESRSGGYDMLGHMGKSYFDSYPDLKCEIEKVKSDRYKVLNLLRMCNLYVQKIPSLPFGYKKPWMDDFSKTILPGSSDGC